MKNRNVLVFFFAVLVMSLALSACTQTPTTTDPTVCQHEMCSEKVEKEAGCLEDGEKSVRCNTCGHVRRVAIPATGHQFVNGLSACTACGLPNSAGPEALKTLLESVTGENLYIQFSGVKLKVVSDVFNVNTLDIRAGEMNMVLDGDQAKLYAQLDAVLEETGADIQLFMYGDGQDLYIKSDANGVVTYRRSPYGADMGDVDVDMGGSIVSGSTPEEIIDGLLGSVLDKDTLDQWKQIAEKSNEAYFTALAEFFGKAWIPSADGRLLILDLTALAEISNDLYNMKMPDLYDKYYGDGSYAKLKQDLLDLGNKTLDSALKSLFEIAREHGISEKLLITTVDAVLTASGGEEFSLEALIDSEKFKKLTVGDVIYQLMVEYPGFEYASFVNQLFDSCRQLTGYQLVFGNTGSSYEMIYNLHNNVVAISEQENVQFYLELDEAGGLSSYGLLANGWKISEDARNSVTLTGEIYCIFEGQIPYGAQSLKQDCDTCFAEAEKGLILALQRAENGEIGYKEYLDYRFFINENGKVQLDISDYIDSYCIEDFFAMNPSVELLCQDVYRLRLSGSCYMETTDWFYDYSVSICFDSQTGAYYEEFEHDYVGYVPENQPADKPASEDAVDCGEYWYYYYSCSRCGLSGCEKRYKDHKLEYIYTLPEGVTSCEEGVAMDACCTVCGYRDPDKSGYSYIHPFVQTDIALSTPHGVLNVRTTNCPCGAFVVFDILDSAEHGSDCVLGEPEFVEKITADGMEGQRFKSSCVSEHTGENGEKLTCELYVIQDKYCTEPDGSGWYRVYQQFRFYVIEDGKSVQIGDVYCDNYRTDGQNIQRR